MTEEKICAYYLCGKTFKTDNKQKKYCSTRCKNNNTVSRSRKELKRKAVEYKGGKCEMCGYDKCIDALDFHHKEPSQKEFGVSKNTHNRKWEDIKKEIEKCMLLCANCHRELHSTIKENIK